MKEKLRLKDLQIKDSLQTIELLKKQNKQLKEDYESITSDGKNINQNHKLVEEIKNNNYICSLAANQTRAFNIHFKPEERKKKIEELKEMQEKLKPETDEIKKVLDEFECPNGFIPSHLADIPPEQLKKLVEEAQGTKEEVPNLDVLSKLK